MLEGGKSLERLDKLVAQARLLTRKEARALIRAGQVTVDGEVCCRPDAHVEPAAQRVLTGGEPVGGKRAVLLMMNKPAGVLTAARDGRDPTFQDLLPEKYARLGLSAAGRLDKDAEGLLLLTDDGELVHRIISPRWKAEKLYYAELDRPAEEKDVAAFAGGLDLGDFVALPARLCILPGSGKACTVTITEGKFHQVKRMFLACGKKVEKLKRLKIGTLELDKTLKSGEIRELSEQERSALYEMTGLL